MLSIFSYVSGPSVCLPWRSVCSSPLPTFWLGYLSSWSRVVWVLYIIYFGDQALVWGTIGKYVFPYGWFCFYFNTVFLAMQKLFILMRSHLFILSFMSLALGDISLEILLHGYLGFSSLCSHLGLLWCHNLYLSLLSTLNLFLCMV